MELPKFNSHARKKIKKCPCGNSNGDGKFVPHIGYEKYEIYGRCWSCEKTFPPPTKLDGSQSDRAVPQYGCPRIEPQQATYIQPQIVQKTMQCYEANNFIIFLHSYLKDAGLVNQLIQRFKIGTAKSKWHSYFEDDIWKKIWLDNRTIFWQIDKVGQVRTGEIMSYNPITGKRIQKYNGWVHKDMKLSDFLPKQCFFGEHQLQTENINKPIAIVESAKTAIIMTAIDQRFIWMASQGFGGVQLHKWKALEYRKVYLFPDLGKYDGWVSEAQKIQDVVNVTIKVSDKLEQYINELSVEQRPSHKGYDIADYAIQFDWYAQLKAKTNQQNMSTDDKILQAMITSNPNLSLLMQRFECINPKTMKAFNV